MPRKLPIFLQKQPTMDELIQIAAGMGVVLSYKMANQALYCAREYTANEKKFDTYKIVKWFSDNIGKLRSIDHDNFKIRRRMKYEERSSQPTVRIFGATLGFGGEFGSKANQVANEIFKPLQTLQTIRFNHESNSTLPGKLVKSPTLTRNGTIFRSLSKPSLGGSNEDVIEIGGIPLGVATQIEADSKNLLTQSISEIVQNLRRHPRSYR